LQHLVGGGGVLGLERRRVRGSEDARATARNGVASGLRSALSTRLSQPSLVLFTPGVPLSM
jgi:hypothetical protein